MDTSESRTSANGSGRNTVTATRTTVSGGRRKQTMSDDDHNNGTDEAPAPAPFLDPVGVDTEQLRERVVAERGDAVIDYDDDDELRDAYVDALRELVDEYEVSCGQDSEERHGELLLSFLVAHESEFLDKVQERDSRYAAYVDDIAPRMKYDASNADDDEWWPFALDEEDENEEMS
jgi:hypothetical protein